MTRILFVDDEERVLDGLRRMLRPMRGKWDMSFVDNGQTALNLMDEQPFDVLVTDIKMPGMNGVELMEAVMQHHPGTVRIALSGHSDQEILLSACEAAHQFLAKPCDAETLSRSINRVCAMRNLLADPEICKMIDSRAGLPSLPSLYSEIQLALQDENTTLAEVGNIISRDVSMTAKIMQIVNSAFFGIPRQVSSPAQAVSLLGVEVVKGLVLSTTVFSAFKSDAKQSLRIDDLWSHSLRSATLARDFAKFAGMDKTAVENTQVAGMLHEVGQLVTATRMPERFDESRGLARSRDIELYQAEKEVFGFTHMDIGGYLLTIWGLPECVVDVAMNHHRPASSACASISPLTCVHIAHCLLDEESGRPKSQLDEDYVRHVGCGEMVEKFLAQMPSEPIGECA